MKKVIATSLMLALLSVSCNKSGGSSSGSSTQPSTSSSTADPKDGTSTDDPTTNTGTDTTTQTPTPAPAPTPAPPASSTLPAQALSFQTNVTLYNFTTAQEAKYQAAIALVKKVIATEKFRTMVLDYTYNGAKQYANNKGLTNAQIYQSILDAAETLHPAKNNTMDLGVKLYYENSTVVGYTSGSIDYINVNTKFFDKYAINSVAANMMHEWLHKLGYTHDFAATAARPHSVPYAVGSIMGTIGKSFL